MFAVAFTPHTLEALSQIADTLGSGLYLSLVCFLFSTFPEGRRLDFIFVGFQNNKPCVCEILHSQEPLSL